MKYIPNAPSIARETITVLLGAILAAAIVGRFPAVKKWMADQWR